MSFSLQLLHRHIPSNQNKLKQALCYGYVGLTFAIVTLKVLPIDNSIIRRHRRSLPNGKDNSLVAMRRGTNEEDTQAIIKFNIARRMIKYL